MKIRNLYDNSYFTYKEFTFPGGEVNVKVEGPAYAEVEIVHHIRSSSDVMALLLVTDALRRNGNHKIDLILPYVPYARQDRVMVPGESLSIKVFCDLINAQKYNQVTIVDPHSGITPALLHNCRIDDNLTFFKWAMYHDSINTIPTLVSPDAGAIKKVYSVAEHLEYYGNIVTAKKHRDVATGKITHTSVDVDYCTGDFMIMDDICDGGRTFIELAKVLKAKGASKVYLAVSHGIFSSGFRELGEHVDKIFVTNSFREVIDIEFKNTNCPVYQLKLW